MRRPTTLLVLAISGALLAACGASRPAPGKAHASAAKGPSSSAQGARAYARAVNLRAADLPGFSVGKEHESETPRERGAERELLSCTGSQGPNTLLARSSSQHFVFKHDVLDLGVSSEVGVARSPALASDELAAIRNARIRTCFSRYLDQIFQGRHFAGAVVRPVTIQAGSPPAPGASGSYGWRVTASLTVRHINLSFYLDILGFVYGPARVTLFSSGALLPFPAAIQQRLYSLLLARAKAVAL